MTHRHTIHEHHLGWNDALEAAVRIAPAESLEFEILDSSGGQISLPNWPVRSYFPRGVFD